MTIDDVINASTITWLEQLKLFNLWEWFLLIFCSTFMTLLITSFCLLPATLSTGETSGTFLGWLFFICVIIAFPFSLHFIASEEAEGSVPENWKEEFAFPYYNNLPLVKIPIEIVSVEKTDHPEIFNISYTENIGHSVMFVETVSAPIITDENINKSSYEYKELTKDIPNFLDAGKYEEVVRVPVGRVLHIK